MENKNNNKPSGHFTLNRESTDNEDPNKYFRPMKTTEEDDNDSNNKRTK